MARFSFSERTLVGETVPLVKRSVFGVGSAAVGLLAAALAACPSKSAFSDRLTLGTNINLTVVSARVQTPEGKSPAAEGCACYLSDTLDVRAPAKTDRAAGTTLNAGPNSSRMSYWYKTILSHGGAESSAMIAGFLKDEEISPQGGHSYAMVAKDFVNGPFPFVEVVLKLANMGTQTETVELFGKGRTLPEATLTTDSEQVAEPSGMLVPGLGFAPQSMVEGMLGGLSVKLAPSATTWLVLRFETKTPVSKGRITFGKGPAMAFRIAP